MEIVLPHSLPPGEVRRRMTAALGLYADRFARYAPEAMWTAAERCTVTFSALGVRTHVEIDVRPTVVVLRARVPLVLRPFLARARSRIEAEASRWLGPSAPHG